ncbi:MAG: hypothetical protein ACRD1N_02780, partial [Terriglobia bacterium]
MISKASRYLLLAILVVTCQALSAEVQFSRHGNEIAIQINGRPFTVYHFDPAIAKPYMSPLRA